MWMKVKRLHENAIVPTRAHSTDAGLDVYCVENEVVYPNRDKLIKTGISIAIPDGWVAVVKEKSGLATKKKVTVGACVIDSGYRGELMIHLFNNGDIPATFVMGDKIAQLVVVPCWVGHPEEVESLDDTPRGDGGFGSTDKVMDFVKLLGRKDLPTVIDGKWVDGAIDSCIPNITKPPLTYPVKLTRKTDTPESKEYWDTVDKVAKQTESWSEEKKLDARSFLNQNIRRAKEECEKLPDWKKRGFDQVPKIKFSEHSSNDSEPQCKYTHEYIKDCNCGDDGIHCSFALPTKEESTNKPDDYWLSYDW